MARLTISKPQTESQALKDYEEHIPVENRSSFYDTRSDFNQSIVLEGVRTAVRPLGKGTDYPVLNLRRVSVRNNSSLMGKSWRNPITGKIHLEDAEHHLDFAIVDLWTRNSISGTLDRLARDKFLFRPVPMNYRTWMYHSLSQYEKDNPSLANSKKPTDWILKDCLASYCIDASLTAGRSSPVAYYATMMPAAIFAMDIMFICIVIFAFVAVLGISKSMSTFDMYKNIRLYTLIPRCIFAFYTLIHFAAAGPLAKGDFIGALAFTSVLVLAVVDLITGDAVQFMSMRLNCSYNLINELPGPVYVCRRFGDLERQARQGCRGHMAFEVTGLHRWDSSPDLSLVADVQGVFCELLPLDLADWEHFAETWKNKPIPYIGLNMYSAERACFLDGLHETGLVEVSKSDSDGMETEAAEIRSGGCVSMPTLKRNMSMWSDLGAETRPSLVRELPPDPPPKHAGDSRSATPVLTRPQLGKKVTCIVEDVED